MIDVNLRVGFVPSGFSAWVPKRGTIIVSEARLASNERLIAHELAHVLQVEEYGLLRYYLNYLIGWVGSGFRYESIPMEAEARKAETEPMMRQWARELIEGYPDGD